MSSLRTTLVTAAMSIALAAQPVLAEAPAIADARAAMADANFEAAQKILLSAVDAGGHTVDDMRVIYMLLARGAAALGQVEIAQQYYRRWLSIDAAAALPDDASPKLREPFTAAKDYVTAHGQLAARASMRGGSITVAVVSDPLAMARSARIAGGATVELDADRRASLPGGPQGDRPIEILDEHGNTLVVVTPAASASTDRSARAPEARESKAWIAWGASAGVLLLGSGVLAILAADAWGEANEAIDNSSQRFFTDADKPATAAKYLTIGSVTAGVIGVGLLIPTVIAYRGRSEVIVAPTASDDGAGVTLFGRF